MTLRDVVTFLGPWFEETTAQWVTRLVQVVVSVWLVLAVTYAVLHAVRWVFTG